MKLYTGPPKFEFGRVEFASGGPGGPPASKVNVEPCIRQRNKHVLLMHLSRMN